jgi:geranylgeranyl diphosphate synthase, type II
MTDKNKNLYPEYLVKIVNERIKYYISAYEEVPRILKKAISYSIENVGKRFRPVLCIVTANSLGTGFEPVLPVACALEYIHTYSLIHDDLPSIDNDDFRRGKLTCHKVFGEDMAILAGDALFAEAYNLVLKYQKSPDDIILRLLKEVTEASGAEGMVAGQITDVYYTGKKLTRSQIEKMHYNKTAKLISASVRCGAIIAGATEPQLSKLTEYALDIGLAFQITDDLLDLESNSGLAGKTLGKDLIQKKNTFPSVFGVKQSKKIATQKINEAISIVENMDIKKDWLINIANFLLCRKN